MTGEYGFPGASPVREKPLCGGRLQPLRSALLRGPGASLGNSRRLVGYFLCPVSFSVLLSEVQGSTLQGARRREAEAAQPKQRAWVFPTVPTARTMPEKRPEPREHDLEQVVVYLCGETRHVSLHDNSCDGNGRRVAMELNDNSMRTTYWADDRGAPGTMGFGPSNRLRKVWTGAARPRAWISAWADGARSRKSRGPRTLNQTSNAARAYRTAGRDWHAAGGDYAI